MCKQTKHALTKVNTKSLANENTSTTTKTATPKPHYPQKAQTLINWKETQINLAPLCFASEYSIISAHTALHMDTEDISRQVWHTLADHFKWTLDTREDAYNDDNDKRYGRLSYICDARTQCQPKIERITGHRTQWAARWRWKLAHEACDSLKIAFYESCFPVNFILISFKFLKWWRRRRRYL